jgi:hypothetical protein
MGCSAFHVKKTAVPLRGKDKNCLWMKMIFDLLRGMADSKNNIQNFSGPCRKSRALKFKQ